MPYSTDPRVAGTDTGSMLRTQGKQMANARIDRMVRELNSEPSSQFFLHLYGLVGLGERPAKAKAESHPMPSFQRVQGEAA